MNIQGEDRESMSAQLGYITRAVEEIHDDVRQGRTEIQEHRKESREHSNMQDGRIEILTNRIVEVEKTQSKWKGIYIGGSIVLTALWAGITFIFR